MRMFCLVSAFVCLLVGCRQEPVGSDAPPVVVPAAETLTATYKGFKADAWYGKLVDTDSETSLRGMNALQAIGEEGVPFLLKGASHGDPYVRYMSLRGLNSGPKTAGSKHLPAIGQAALEGLKDSNPYARAEAALLVNTLGVRNAGPLLRNAMEGVTDKEARGRIEEAAKAYEKLQH